MTSRLPIDLYQHAERDQALLVSRVGLYEAPTWIPRSLMTEPLATKLTKLNGIAVQMGTFKIEKWKLEELRWLDEAGEGQEELAL